MVRKVSFREFNEMLHNGKVRFQYVKKDGSVRTAVGTLKGDLITVKSKGGESTVKNAGYTVYFDLEKEAFRCFAENKFVGVVEG